MPARSSSLDDVDNNLLERLLHCIGTVAYILLMCSNKKISFLDTHVYQNVIHYLIVSIMKLFYHKFEYVFM